MRQRRPDQQWQLRSRGVMAQGQSSPNSKRPSQYIEGVYPSHVTRGEGCYLFDFVDNKYIDFVCALGSNILGYSNERVNSAVARQIYKGANFSLPSTLEVEVAEQVRVLIPAAEKIRFLKTGSEACSAAVRIARAATGKSICYSRGYHGHSDLFTSLTAPALGVEDEFAIRSLGDDLSVLENDDVACVIVEALELRMDDEWQVYLNLLREVCTKRKIVLIFDEVITGLRVPKYSVSSMYSIKPDIICLGKAIANGYPLAVVAGTPEVMDSCEYFISSTFSGEAIALAACQATMTEVVVKRRVDDLCFYGGRLMARLNALALPGFKLEGYGSRGMLNVTNLATALFMQEMCKAGVLFGKAFFFSFAHLEEDVESMIMNIADDAARRILSGQVKLEGSAPVETFKR